MRNKELIAADKAFLEWVRKQPSCISGEYSEYVDGEGRCIAAHVRRAGKSGTGYKPLFSAIPMTNSEHEFQHQHGEYAMIAEYGIFDTQFFDERDAKEWFSEMAASFFGKWFCECANEKQKEVALKFLVE